MAENTLDNKPKRRGRRLKPVEADLEVEDDELDEDDDEVDGRGITAGKGRPTPGRRNAADVEKEAESGNIVTRPFNAILEYFEGVRSELNKVSWPTRTDVRNLSIIVLATTITASLILGLVGLGFTELFRIGLATPSIFLVVFIIVGAVAFWLYRRSQNSTTEY